MATEHASADVIVKINETDIIDAFAPTCTVISENATCFSGTELLDRMKHYGVLWMPLLAFALMSNVSAERMVEH